MHHSPDSGWTAGKQGRPCRQPRFPISTEKGQKEKKTISLCKVGIESFHGYWWSDDSYNQIGRSKIYISPFYAKCFPLLEQQERKKEFVNLLQCKPHSYSWKLHAKQKPHLFWWWNGSLQASPSIAVGR